MLHQVASLLGLFSIAHAPTGAPDVISVLLPYRNAAATLRSAASSALDDLGPDDEIVLVDDGSTDTSAPVAWSVGPGDPRVIHVSGDGRGIAAALERARAVSRGELLARMDADDVSLPGRFAAQREALEADASLGVVATRIALIGSPGPGIERYVAWQNGLVTADDHARSIFVESPVCHPSTMIRASVLEALGGFREGPFAEDYDLWLRVAAAGFGIAKLPRVLLQWRIHDTNTTWNDPRLSFDALRRLRASHLAHFIDRPFGVWGSGPAGRRLARELEPHGKRASFFVDIDPKKVGNRRRDAPILSIDAAMERTEASGELLVVAVATPGARDFVRGILIDAGRDERRDFICAA